MFGAPTHKYGGFDDYYRMANLVVGLSDGDSFNLRKAGEARAREILKMHRSEVEQLAERLMRERLIKDA
jgi:hypothetical protein